MSEGDAALSVPGVARAQDQQDLALRGLVLLAQFHGIAADASQLAHDAGLGNAPMDETINMVKISILEELNA